MVPDETLQKVVDFTNIKINKARELTDTSLAETDKKTQHKLNSADEITTLFGVFYMQGALRKNTMEINIVFYHETDPMFSSPFERKRLSFLCKIIQFDDSWLRKERWSADKFPAFRDFYHTDV